MSKHQDLLSICLSVECNEDFSIISATSEEGVWTLEIRRTKGKRTSSDMLEVMMKLNGYNRADYFSVLKYERLEDEKGEKFRIVTKRVVEEGSGENKAEGE